MIPSNNSPILEHSVPAISDKEMITRTSSITTQNKIKKDALRRIWIDPNFPKNSVHPWRKVDIEYHNSRFIPRIGERFDAATFGECLTSAHVNGAVIFAKDMFGYSYFPTNYGPVHPGLSFDLLGAQVAELRRRGIAIYAYYMTTWNLELAERRPEWLAIKRDRTNRLPKFDETPGCSQETGVCITSELCLSHNDFVKLELDHIRELVSKYEIDALWIDGAHGSQTHSPECYCHNCLRQLRDAGLNPLDEQVQYNRQTALNLSFLEGIHKVVKEERPNCDVGPQNEGSFGLRNRVQFMEYTDLEGLFTDTRWYGYYYAPTVIRYARGFGLTTFGLTTRFKGFWGDFGGLKLSSQLLTEVATMVANGARCDIGDQMHPNGKLDPAVYHVIGEVYAKIEQAEPYLSQAVPVTEAALIVGGRPLEIPCTETNFGWVKLLTESRLQFDIVESSAPWERYSLVILPEELSVDETLASRLRAYVDGGGSIIVSDASGLLAGTERSWLESYGLRYAQKSPFKPAYLVPQEGFTGNIPSFEYALYEGSSQWETQQPAVALALLGEPLFQRSPEHYTSHAQTPYDHTTSYATIALSGRIALFSFSLGKSYYDQGYWIYRDVFRNVLSRLLPGPLIQSDIPMSSEITLTHQDANTNLKRKERYLTHIINYSPLRHTPRHSVFCEDPIPITNAIIRLNLPLEVGIARAIFAGEDLPVRKNNGGVEVYVPRIPVYEVLSFEGSLA